MRHSSHRAIGTLILGAALLMSADPARGQQLAAARAPAAVGAAPTSTIDAAAMAALNKMGEYLRTLTTFQVTADITTEDVLQDGQKIQIANTANLIVQKPNKLRLDVTSDNKRRLFFFDGSSFTLFSPISTFYATVPASGTVRDLVDSLDTKYGIEMPFADLFRWGTPESNASLITGAADIGPSDIDGVTCEQYAFRQADVDWQVWIQLGDFPIPRKLVISTLTDEARPEYVALYTWNLAPSVDNASFTFNPPDDAKKVPLVEVGSAGRILRPKEPKK